MPLKSLINRSMLGPEDADLLESVFNQFSAQNEEEDQRVMRAAGLVKMFVEGERDRDRLIRYLVDTGPHQTDQTMP